MMGSLFSLDRVKRSESDPLLTALVILITGLGLSFLFSASWFHGERLFGNPWYFLSRQSLLVAAGAGAAWVISRMDLSQMSRFILPLLGLALVLMLMTFLPFLSKPIYGARRWLDLGIITFQPSEFAKPVLLLYLANFLAKREGHLERVAESVLPPLGVFTLFILLSLGQNDYSAGFFMVFIGLGLYFLAGLQLRYFAPLFVFGIPLSLIFLFTKAYRVERLITFLNPLFDPTGVGYQLRAARKALAEGGLLGQGLGAGVRKMGALPEVQSDFILAVVAEETGLLGIVVLFGLFGLLAWQGFRISLKTQDPFRRYLGYGITITIFFQFLVNAAVVSGAIPATGIPLPFFSAGGSSILITLMMVGLLVNISRDKEVIRGGQ